MPYFETTLPHRSMQSKKRSMGISAVALDIDRYLMQPTRFLRSRFAENQMQMELRNAVGKTVPEVAV